MNLTSRRRARAAAIVVAAALAATVLSAAPANATIVTTGYDTSTSTGTLGPAAPGNAITRSVVLSRAQEWTTQPTYYSQTEGWSDTATGGPYRLDCSGFVSMAWGLTTSKTTATLPSVATVIARSALEPGDALDDVTDGHVFLFAGWISQSAGTFYDYAEHTTGEIATYETDNFNDSTIMGHPTANYTPYRYNNITEASAQVAQGGVIADFNGDGKPDVATLNLSGDGLWINGNTSIPGSPSIAAGQSVSAGWSSVNNLMTADVDGDGKADIIGRVGDTLAVWRNTSTATTFSFVYTSLGTGWSNFSKLLPMADFNGDGKPDIAALNLSGDGLWIFNNTSTSGHPSIGAGQSVSTGWNAVDNITTGDYDRDGKADIIGRYGDVLAVWRNTTTGSAYTFSYTNLGTGWSNFSKLLPLADYNGDGKPDLAALNLSGDGLWIFNNTSTSGHPSIAAGQSVSSGWSSVNSLMVGDYDSSGKADIMGRYGDIFAVWRNTTTGSTYTFSYTNLGTGWSNYSKFITSAPLI